MQFRSGDKSQRERWGQIEHTLCGWKDKNQRIEIGFFESLKKEGSIWRICRIIRYSAEDDR